MEIAGSTELLEGGLAAAALDALPSSVAVLDPDGRILAVNRPWRAFAEANGAAVEAVGPGADYLAVCRAAAEAGDEDARAFCEGLRAVLGGRRDVAERRYPCHSATERRWFLARATAFDRAGARHAIVSHVDVTERVLAELALGRQEHRFRSLIEHATEIVTMMDGDGYVVYQSPAVERVLGYRPDEMVGRSALDPIHPDDLGRALEGFTRRFDPGEGTEGSIRVRSRHRDGSYRWLEATFANRLDDPDVRAVISWSRDVTEVVRAEEAARAAADRLAGRERWFRGLVENSLDLTTILDPRGVVTYQSPSIERVLGYGRDELVGRNAFELVHPHDLEALAAAFGSAVAEPGAVRRMEYRYRHADGTWRHIESIGHNLLHDPSILGVVVNSRDVTDRVEAGRAAHENERRLQTLVEQLPGAVVYTLATDPQRGKTIAYLSPQVESLLGHPLEEWFSAPDAWRRFIHPDDEARISEAIRISEETGSAYEAEYRYVAADGRVVWVKDRTEPISWGPDGRPDRFQGVFVDISDVKEAEELLRLLESAVEAQPAAVLVFEDFTPGSGEPVVSYVNPAYEAMTGYTSDEVVGRTAPPLTGPETDPEAERRYHEAIADRLPHQDEIVAYRKDGSRFLLEWQMGPIRDAAGTCTHWVVLARDVTDLREAERALRGGLEELRRVESERRRLLERIVELQDAERARLAEGIEDESIQQVTALGLRLEQLRRSLDDPEQLEALGKLDDAVGRTVGGLRALLFELRPRSLETGGLGAAIRGYVSAAAERAGFASEVRDRVSDDLPDALEGTAYRIVQEAVSNISRHAGARKVTIELDRVDDRLVVRVRDDGTGFDVEAVEARPAEERRGLLGMRERTSLAGGSLEIRSASGEGTCVELRLPIRERLAP